MLRFYSKQLISAAKSPSLFCYIECWVRYRFFFLIVTACIYCFPGALCLPGVPGCPCSKPVSPQGSPQLSRSSSLFSNPSRRSGCKTPYLSPQRTVDTTASLNECCCCCCNEDLLKLQVIGLLFGGSLAGLFLERFSIR